MKENSSIWDLLAKRTDHSLSKEEAEALEQMLKEDTSLQRASQLVDDSLVNMDTRQVEEVMNRTWSKVESGMKANRKPRLKLIIRRCAVAASIAVLCVLGGVLGYQLWAKPDMLIVMNQGKEALLFTLPDNSKVWLGGGSSLKYPDKLSARNREVYLDGEAFFDVKKDNGRTFQVVTELVEVKVLGTRLHRLDRFTLSVRMYVIRPFSYRRCATIMVCDTENPSLRAASCCSVEVVNGGAGMRLSGFLLTLSTLCSAFLHLSRNARASSCVVNRLSSSAFTSDCDPSALVMANMALMR